jgi:hypothetical protein
LDGEEPRGGFVALFQESQGSGPDASGVVVESVDDAEVEIPEYPRTHTVFIEDVKGMTRSVRHDSMELLGGLREVFGSHLQGNHVQLA